MALTINHLQIRMRFTNLMCTLLYDLDYLWGEDYDYILLVGIPTMYSKLL